MEREGREEKEKREEGRDDEGEKREEGNYAKIKVYLKTRVAECM